jgi:signal transduction histidine kinase
MVEPTTVVPPADLPDRSRSRIERIVAVGRLVFAGFTFVALTLDPSAPPRHAQIAYTLIVLYAIYAAGFAAYAWWRTPSERAGLLTHVVDLLLIPTFMYLTAWTTSPFFVYFTFALVVAVMRWQWRGVLWTAVFSIAAFNALGAYAGGVLQDPAFELNRFIIRNFYLVVTSVLLGYLGYFESELRTELARRLRKGAAAEERVRLARDLHDGLLQTLTGTALQLQTAERLMDVEPGRARGVLGDVRRMIADEQRDLRFFIQELKPGQIGALDDGGGLDAALRDLGRRLLSVWGLRLELPSVVPAFAASEASLGEIYRIVQEAAVNAARHGQATQVTVTFELRNGGLAIGVADNGRGFPFHGRYAHDTAIALRRGPRTLRERVVGLGGTLDIDSSEAGSRLDILVPIEASRS